MSTTKERREIIERFQCPGCVCGSDTTCGSFAVEEQGEAFRCESHVLGTSIGHPGNKVALGMPKGFNKPRIQPDRKGLESQMRIWLHEKGASTSEVDWLNLAVWLREETGFLFVRCYSPRVDDSYILVIEEGNPDDFPGALDISGRLGEID